MYHFRTELLMQNVERTHGIAKRWTSCSQEYVTTKAMMNSNLRIKLKKDIRKHARERWFLLRLKSKYAGILYIYIPWLVGIFSKCTTQVRDQRKFNLPLINHEPEGQGVYQ